jgi:hypothetical protein
MLLPENVHPANTLYFNGAMILDALQQLREADLFDLFLESRKRADITMPLFVLSLDWLFLADCVVRNSEGNFVLCS